MQNIDYNVPGGKLNRGMSVVDSVEILKRRKLDGEEYFKAALLGWCVEFVSLSSPQYFSAARCAQPVTARNVSLSKMLTACARTSSKRTSSSPTT